MNRLPPSLAPHSEDIERQLLGALLHDAAAVSECGDLEPGHFFFLQNGWVFEAIRRVAKSGVSYSSLRLVVDELARAGHLDEIGDTAYRGESYLYKLLTETYTSAHVAEYAARVRDYATRRALLEAAQRVAKLAYEEDTDIGDVVERASAEVAACAEGVNRGGVVWWQDVASATYDMLGDRRLNGGVTGDFPTPLPDLNKLLFGVAPGEVLIVAGAPKIGKTSLMLQIAFEFARRAPGVFYSLEMDETALMQRVIAQETGISTDAQRDMTDEQWRAFHDWFTTENVMRPILFDKDRAATAGLIAAKLRAYRRQYGIEWAVVDYLQLMSTDAGRRGGNRNNEIDDMLRTLKLAAMELRIRLVVGSQFSREFIRAGRKPMLQDLRDSGSIEQHADKVVLIHNEGGYTTEALAANSRRELIVAAHRNGPIGEVGATWLAQRMRFVSLAHRP